jgi:zinc/manganese transport system substrate-binding protein
MSSVLELTVHTLSKLIKYSFFIVSLCLAQPAFAKLEILACEPEWAALVTEIGDKHVKVTSATTAMQDPHQIQARPSLIAKARRADLIACSGAGLEAGWLPVLLKKSANPNIQIGKPGHFIATKHVELEGKIAGNQSKLHAAGNPHVHFDPHRILKIASALTDALSQIDTENAASYQNNLKHFSDTWNAAIQDWQQKTADLKNTAVIVHHDSWVYLVQWLDLKQIATLEPRHGVPPSTRYLAELLERLKGQPVDMILRSGYEDERPSKWLSEKTGIPIVSIPFSVSDYNQKGSLKQWMDKVIDNLLQGKAI